MAITTRLLSRSWQRIVLITSLFFVIRQISLSNDAFSDGPIICPIRLLTGYPCPACGTTRSIGCITIGRFNDAWQLNPLGFLTLLIVFFWGLKVDWLRIWLRKLQKYLAAQGLARQILLIGGAYGIAWAATIFRWNTAIL